MDERWEQIDFSTFLTERARERGLNVKRLSEMTGISAAHLENLMRGNYEALPAHPYVRGYLRTLGRVLDFDAESWWNHFKEVELIKRSGAHDALPQNRFAWRSSRASWLLACILVLLILYVAVRFSAIAGKPTLIFENPKNEITVVSESPFVFSGRLRGGDALYVNGEQVLLGADGFWEKSVLLETGLNTIEIRAEKFLGRETRVIRQVLYEPRETQAQ